MGRRRTCHADISKKKGNVLENLEGSIERWFAPRGYGFIEIPGKGDVFVHVNDIIGLTSTDALNYSIWGHSLQGSKVRFSVVETVRGYKAKNVEITEQKVHEPPLLEKGHAGQQPYGHTQHTQHTQMGKDDHISGAVQGVHAMMRPPPYSGSPHGGSPHGNHTQHDANNVIRLPPAWLRTIKMAAPAPPPPVQEHQQHPAPPKPMNLGRQPDAYSNMCRNTLRECVADVVPRDIHFYNCLVDYIVEFAGTISLSLINFNNNTGMKPQYAGMSGPMGPMMPMSAQYGPPPVQTVPPYDSTGRFYANFAEYVD